MEKTSKVLILFYRLLDGEHIHKDIFAMEYGTVIRSVDRYIRTIRDMLLDIHAPHELLFDQLENAYYLTGIEKATIPKEYALSILLTLLGTRALCKEEVDEITDSIVKALPSYARSAVVESARSLAQGYVEPTHRQQLLKMQWDLCYCIRRRQKVKLTYERGDGNTTERKVLPISVSISECYYYLVAFLEGKGYDEPAFFRLDRIRSFKLVEEYYSQRQHDGYRWEDKRKAVQFMFTGKLQQVTLKCSHTALEAVRDRLPGNKVIARDADSCTIQADVYSEGFLRWVTMQGNAVEILEPEELRESMRARLKAMLKIYEKK